MNQRPGRAGVPALERRRDLSAIRRGLASSLCWALAASAGFGQGRLFELSGDAYPAGFGSFIAAAGDVNADGYPDLLVGIPLEPKGRIVPGNVRVHSGKDGALLYSKYGSTDGEYLGVGVAGGFDMNQDGFADFLVGAPGAPFGSALRALLYSGKDRSILWSADGDAADDGFGYAVANCGDVDQDGVKDWVVGAAGAMFAGARVGFIRVFSGSTGSVLYTVYGSDTDAAFGYAVAGAGDVDGDGFDDILVGSPYSSVSRLHGGRVQVYSGNTSSLILDEQGDLIDDLYLGWSVSGTGDLDLDGFADVLAGTIQYCADCCPSNYGFAWAYSGQTGAALYPYQGDSKNDVFGISVHGCGDVNRDGWSDFIIGAPQIPNTPVIFGCDTGPGYARLYSGRTGVPLYNFAGEGPIDMFGYAVSDVGDVNLDGFPDVAVGATGAVTIDVLAGNDLYLSASSRRPAAGDVLTLSTREGPAGNPVATFLVEVNGTPASTLLRLSVFDSTFGYAFSVTVPSGLSGYEFAFQSFAIGPSGKVIDSAPETVTIQ